MISKREYELLVKFQDGYAPLCGLDPEDEELKDQYLIKKGAVINDGRTYLTEWVLTGKGKDALTRFKQRQKTAKYRIAWAGITFLVPTIISVIALVHSLL